MEPEAVLDYGNQWSMCMLACNIRRCCPLQAKNKERGVNWAFTQQDQFALCLERSAVKAANFPRHFMADCSLQVTDINS